MKREGKRLNESKVMQSILDYLENKDISVDIKSDIQEDVKDFLQSKEVYNNHFIKLDEKVGSYVQNKDDESYLDEYDEDNHNYVYLYENKEKLDSTQYPMVERTGEGLEELVDEEELDAKFNDSTFEEEAKHIGVLYVNISANNTHMSVRWTDGKQCKQVSQSCGAVGFKGTKRGTSYAAEQLAHTIAEDIEGQISSVHILFDGMGRGRASVAGIIEDHGIKVVSVSDATGMPHNGCRPKKKRRI